MYTRSCGVFNWYDAQKYKERVEYTYTGYRTLIYFKYLDAKAEHVLVADPGGQYEILSCDGDPVPPGDGFWKDAPPPPPPPPPVPLPKVFKPETDKTGIVTEKAGE